MQYLLLLSYKSGGQGESNGSTLFLLSHHAAWPGRTRSMT